MATIIFRNARVVSPSHVPGKDVKIPRRGELANALAITPSADVTVKDGLIESIKPIKPDTRPRKPAPGATEIDANGRVLMPGFVDCHTHACWAGSRIDEWDLKRRGVSYLDILKRGGGIMATVRAVRAASEQQLTDLLLERLNLMLRYGTTTVEVKSGYGLTTADELKMLHAIARAAAHWPGTIRPTALLGHAIDEEQPGFVGLTVRQTLPAVAAEFPPHPACRSTRIASGLHGRLSSACCSLAALTSSATRSGCTPISSTALAWCLRRCGWTP